MSARLSSFPPYRHLSQAVPISPAVALEKIQEYLTASTENPHLHPDCIFTETGPTFSRFAGTGGLVLHQLRRVEKGLKGEWLGRDIEGELLQDGFESDGYGIRTPSAADAGAGDDTKLNAAIVAATNAIVEDVEEDEQEPVVEGYQEQFSEEGEGEVEGEIGKRNNAIKHGGEVPSVTDTGKAKKRRRDEDEETPIKDKEARKLAKKERRKQEKKEKEEERKKGNDDIKSYVEEEHSQLPNGETRSGAEDEDAETPFKDKAAKKLAKKEKRKQEKKEREEERKKKNDVEEDHGQLPNGEAPSGAEDKDEDEAHTIPVPSARTPKTASKDIPSPAVNEKKKKKRKEKEEDRGNQTNETPKSRLTKATLADDTEEDASQPKVLVKSSQKPHDKPNPLLDHTQSKKEGKLKPIVNGVKERVPETPPSAATKKRNPYLLPDLSFEDIESSAESEKRRLKMERKEEKRQRKEEKRKRKDERAA